MTDRRYTPTSFQSGRHFHHSGKVRKLSPVLAPNLGVRAQLTFTHARSCAVLKTWETGR